MRRLDANSPRVCSVCALKPDERCTTHMPTINRTRGGKCRQDTKTYRRTATHRRENGPQQQAQTQPSMPARTQTRTWTYSTCSQPCARAQTLERDAGLTSITSSSNSSPAAGTTMVSPSVTTVKRRSAASMAALGLDTTCGEGGHLQPPTRVGGGGRGTRRGRKPHPTEVHTSHNTASRMALCAERG